MRDASTSGRGPLSARETPSTRPNSPSPPTHSATLHPSPRTTPRLSPSAPTPPVKICKPCASRQKRWQRNCFHRVRGKHSWLMERYRGPPGPPRPPLRTRPTLKLATRVHGTWQGTRRDGETFTASVSVRSGARSSPGFNSSGILSKNYFITVVLNQQTFDGRFVKSYEDKSAS